MNLPIFAVILLGFIASVRVRVSAVILGQPVSVPVIGIIAAVVVLALLAVVLWLARNLVRDGLALRAPSRSVT